MNLQLTELDLARARIVELEAELAEWERQFGERGPNDAELLRTVRIRVMLRVRRGAALLIARLAERRGSIVVKEALHALVSLDEETNIKIVDVYLSHARAALWEGAIETIWGTGLRMSVEHAQRLDERLARAGDFPLGRSCRGARPRT